MDRISQLEKQILSVNQTASKKEYTPPKSKRKLDWFKEDGWGYKDTQFQLGSDGIIRLTGNRYDISGKKLPHFRLWAEERLGLDVTKTTPSQQRIPVDPPLRNEEFIKDIEGCYDQITFDDKERIFHSHGHSLQELFYIRNSKLPRSVDCVVYVNSTQQVEKIVQAAIKHNVLIIPFGGGTNVTQALMCDKNEARMILSMDMGRLNHIKWIDQKSMTACIEAGIYGQDLEKELARHGLVIGHEPDSVEFSSLGGWVATRASGMKKNKYGNIDDIVINIKIVTPQGTFMKAQNCPRISSGPDINHFILGSEGTLGVITEVILKVKKMPKKIEFDSIIFHDFDLGIQFMYDVAMSKIMPASIRLVDNTQFQFSHALKEETNSSYKVFVDNAKKYFVTQIKKFNPQKMAVCTLVYEGSEQEVAHQQNNINTISQKYKGLRAGGENGKRGYFLTFAIAYLRDFAFGYQFIAESFETSVPWKNVALLCKNVNQRILNDCKELNVQGQPFVSFRVTQLYDTGAAVYIYFGFLYGNLKDPVATYEYIEDSAREEIMKCGGSISHHHGVGKLRKKFLENSIGGTGVDILKGLKKSVDPTNVFGNGNLF